MVQGVIVMIYAPEDPIATRLRIMPRGMAGTTFVPLAISGRSCAQCGPAA